MIKSDPNAQDPGEYNSQALVGNYRQSLVSLLNVSKRSLCNTESDQMERSEANMRAARIWAIHSVQLRLGLRWLLCQPEPQVWLPTARRHFCPLSSFTIVATSYVYTDLTIHTENGSYFYWSLNTVALSCKYDWRQNSSSMNTCDRVMHMQGQLTTLWWLLPECCRA